MTFAPKTLRELIADFSEFELDCVCASLKTTVKIPTGGTIKTDYSERRAKKIADQRAKARGESND